MATQVSLTDGAVASAGALAIQTNGNTQAVSISTGQVATLAQNPILTSGTANGVAYLNGSKVLTTGSALTFDGTNLGVGTTATDTNSYGRAVDVIGTNGASYYARNSGNNTIGFFGAYYGAFNSVNLGSTTNSDIVFYRQNSEQMRLTSTGLGVGNTSPSSYNSAADNLVIGTSGSNGMTIVSGSTSSGYIMFADGTTGQQAYEGQITYDHTNNFMALNTSGTERVRIDSSGNLLVGATSNAVGAYTAKTLVNSGSANGRITVTTSAASYSDFFFTSSSTLAGSIYINGAATTYNTSSDYRLKDISGPVTGLEAKNFIMALQPKQGTWKSDGSRFVGFLAHEFQEVSPSSVSGVKDAVDEDGNPIMQGMQASSSEVMANLIALVQEQQSIITQLTARITALEGA